jgi:EAL domain-containing protein (putative c-di-GMP-specific phosphodiesterase class I)/AmiR/NasT family two-component response regulator
VKNTIKASVIVVDDSEIIRTVMQAMLENQDKLDVACFASGKEALPAIAKQPENTTLVFIDLNMPEMDGMEVIRRLGRSGFKGGVVIFSDLEKRIISLASDIAKKNQIHLITSISKPITEENVSAALEKFYSFLDRMQQPNTNMTVEEIEHAIQTGRLTPYYQPKIDMASQRLVGLELLARIVTPGNTDAITADAFIPVADACGLIDELTLTLLEKALIEFKEIEQYAQQFFTLSLNLSPNQLGNLDSINLIYHLFETHNIQPEQIIIEITEESALQTSKQLETLNRFKMNGYGISLDDFGSGFTNIKQLSQLPLSEVKIDRSLITNIHLDGFSQIIVNTLIELSQELNFSLTAEGIETINELNYLQSLDAELSLQGFMISKPKPKDEIIRWLNNWQKQTD